MTDRPNIKSVQPVINAAEDDSEADEPAEMTAKEVSFFGKLMAALKEAGIVKEGDDENSIMGAVASLIQALVWKREETARQATLATQMRTALNALSDASAMADDVLPGEIITQLNAILTDRDTQATKVTELTQRINVLTAERDTERSERINATVERAIETGRIIKADEDSIRAELNTDFEAALCKLNARSVQLNSKPLDIGGSKPGIYQASERVVRLNAWVENYIQEKRCSYDEAWAASEADPQMKAVHEAMRAADKARSTSTAD